MSSDVVLDSMLNASIIIYRGASETLDAQSVRLSFGPRGAERVSAGGSVVRTVLRMYGDEDLDVKRGDRFTVNSQWFKVALVHPDYVDETGAAVMTVADCEIEE